MKLEDFYTEEEVLAVMKISRDTLLRRMGRGTEHPPAHAIGRGVFVFNKRLFEDWLSSRPILWEVRRAS